LLAEIIALILAFVFTGDLTALLNRAAVESIQFHYGVSSPVGFAVTQAWDFTHVQVCVIVGSTTLTRKHA